jgi:phage shock protein C
MHVSQPNTAAKDDIFGVCSALGRDFGFNPLYLRIAIGVLLLWNPVAVICGYAVTGLVVAFTHIVAPDPRRAAKRGELATG